MLYIDDMEQQNWKINEQRTDDSVGSSIWHEWYRHLNFHIRWFNQLSRHSNDSNRGTYLTMSINRIRTNEMMLIEFNVWFIFMEWLKVCWECHSSGLAFDLDRYKMKKSSISDIKDNIGQSFEQMETFL